ncbi:P-loop containing nucleoside triphosphate hydrolase protein [Radiomyces spectabilis]|uniref:P-loop containing nucleoside triphosphate hydrolase protein n=1 Tax=Radiomyces spectabilis TaxID=64574 RepID=UPI00221E9BDB|nr:P-loop containing nucleoside triphosphate hydrolase protein [Radiomyces spectabilis]KAI8376162.1 P-loop containing nucleoside triphosphate hydrolase protein [Radiomyces spectabilis]
MMQHCRSLLIAAEHQSGRCLFAKRSSSLCFSTRFTSTSTNTAPETLSNRQKFNRIQPPLKLYEKLERLGFGTLRTTKRYQTVHKQKSQKTKSVHSEVAPEPEYQLPLMSFYAGAKTPASFPVENGEEVAFVGRSNVGKSSLLNSLASTTIVRTSDKPGLTQQINFYSVGRLFTMVDMPGYGFAFVDDEQRQQWRNLMERYVSERKALKRIFVVIDARHGIKVADLDFLKMLETKRVKFQIIMTKCDLQVLPTLARRIMVVQDAIQPFRNAVKHVIVVSSKTGAGINQMRKEMLFLMGHLKEKEFYQEKANPKLDKK